MAAVEEGGGVKWRIIDPCPVLQEGRYLCSGERGHGGLHYASEWEQGEIVGDVYWDDDGRTLDPPVTNP